jgi:hypothetical protein
MCAGLFVSVHTRSICSVTGAEGRLHDAGMEVTTRLQKAGRALLLRLVAEHGFAGAARVLRALADELEAIGATAVRRSTQAHAPTAADGNSGRGLPDVPVS